MIRRVAKIRSGVGTLTLPAGSAYELEQVLDHAEHSARRYGGARVDVGRIACHVGHDHGRSAQCSACQRALPGLTYRVKPHTFCRSCAQHHLERRTSLPARPATRAAVGL